VDADLAIPLQRAQAQVIIRAALGLLDVLTTDVVDR
jgi:hypothetical protein